MFFTEMEFDEISEFKRDFKKCSKKYRTLDKDFKQFKRIVSFAPQGDGTKHWNLLTRDGSVEIYKVRMHCDATKGKFFRVIYACHLDTKNSIQKVEMIEFVEIYFKGKKEAEDKGRIQRYIASFDSKDS